MGKRILTCKIISSFFGYLYESGMEKYKKGTHLTANPFTSMKTKPSDSAEVKLLFLSQGNTTTSRLHPSLRLPTNSC